MSVLYWIAAITFLLLCLLPVYTEYRTSKWVRVVGGFVTCAYNATIGSLCFLSPPESWQETYCARLRRYQVSGGWRGKLADLNLRVILLFDPKGEHHLD